jgi:hypothetical protein
VQGAAAARKRVRIIGLQGRRVIVARHGFREPVRLLQREAEIRMRGRVPGVDGKPLRDRSHGIVVAAVGIPDDPEQVQRIEMLRHSRENLAIESLGRGERAAPVMRDRLLQRRRDGSG